MTPPVAWSPTRLLGLAQRQLAALRQLTALALALALLLATPVSAAMALGVGDLPARLPTDHVLDQAELLSRAARGELEQKLESLAADRVDARLVTVARLDYGLTLSELGQQLIERWSAEADDRSDPLLLLLIDGQNNGSAVVAAPALSGQLPASLLRSTASSTMATSLRDGARYRQASIDALQRITTVLQGGEDTGEPELAEVPVPVANVPSREETSESNAFTWVIVLLVVGSVVPMITWWVFSR